MANAANLINFGAGGGTAVGDVVYSAYPLTAPSYLPLNNGTASYLTSSYPALGAIYAPTTVAYSTASTTIPYSASSSSPYKYVFGNNIFLGWNPNGNIITSPDTVTWVSSAINTDQIYKVAIRATSPSPATDGTFAMSSVYLWQGMAYGNGRFVAIRNAPVFGGTTNTASVIVNSIGATAVSADNGQTWIQGTLPNYGGAANVRTYWSSIGFSNGRFVASGRTDSDGTNFYLALAYSSDGVTWSSPTFYTSAGSSAGLTQVNTIASNGSVYVTVSSDNTSTAAWYTSGTSTLSWNLSTLPTNQKWKSIAYGAGVFVAVGSALNDGATTAAASSTNGSSWTARTMPASLDWTSVTYANGYFVAVANTFPAATSAVATSTDGISWTLRTTTSDTVRDGIAGGIGKFVYAGPSTTTTATVISLNTAASTFTLPIVAPMKGMIPYMKAT